MSKSKTIQKKVIQDSDEDSSSQLPLIQTKKEQIKAKKDVKKVQPQSSQEDQTPVAKPKKTEKAGKASKPSMDQEEEPIQKKAVKAVKTQTGPQRKKSVDKKKKKVQSSEQQSSEEQVAKKVVVKAKSPVQKPIAKKVAKKQSSSQESSQEQAKVVKKSVKSPVQKPVAKKIVKKQSSSEQSSEEEKPQKKATKSPVQKAIVSKKKPVQQDSEQSSSQQAPKKKVPAKSPVQKPKSPVQKPIAAKKKVQQSQQEQQEKAPIRKVSKDSIKVTKKVQASEPQQECQVCVQGLSFNAFDSDIRTLFDSCGEVVHVNLLMRPDGKPKGTAFVKFNKRSALNKALQLNQTEHLGRQIRVQQARGRQGGQGGQQGGARNGGNKSFQSNAVIQTSTLFIGGLSYQSTNESIKDFFTQVGQVQSARVVTDKQTGNPRGFGYVQFYDVQTAKKAYATLNGAKMDGRNIRLDSAAQRDRPQNGGGNRGSFGGNRGSFGGSGFGGGNRGPSRNPGNSTVILSQDDKNAKKGAIGTFQGKKMTF